MAVTEARLTEVAGGIDAGDGKETPLGGSYRTQYFVKCSSSSDTPDIVLRYFRQHTSLPWIGRSFKVGNGFDAFSICRAINPTYIKDSEGAYSVEVRFEPLKVQEEEGDSLDGQSRDPLTWHDDIEVSFTQFSTPVTKATFRGFGGVNNPFMPAGRVLPITNSARVPLDPPAEREVDVKIIRISKAADSYDDSGFERFNGSVNTDRVIIRKPDYRFTTTIAPFCGRIKVIGGAFAIANGVRYWRQTVEVHVISDGRPEADGFVRTWRSQFLDQGVDELYRSGETLPSGIVLNAATAPNGFLYDRIKDNDGNPIGAPLNFDGKGKRLGPGALAIYGTWSVYKELSWAGIRW